jgi:hypothetical protein
MLSADSDDRVDPMHARKFAAALQAATTGGPVLLRIERNAGHGGADLIKRPWSRARISTLSRWPRRAGAIASERASSRRGERPGIRIRGVRQAILLGANLSRLVGCETICRAEADSIRAGATRISFIGVRLPLLLIRAFWVC